LGGYDKLSHTVINPDSYDRQYYDWSDQFGFQVSYSEGDTLHFPDYTLLSHAPPDARQAAKIVKKLE